ncbi:nucleotidyltransferase [candidate division KSB1 bacterium]|nr:nucleotidyltransferase [candidate division KSB1 bacterium]
MLNQDYKEMLSILLENKVDFLLVGAYAMAAHGYPRATADLDIFIRPDVENAKKVYKALADFGAPMDSVTIGDFEKPGTIFQIGVIPRRIDVINEIDGVLYEEADKDKVIVDIEGLKVPIISKPKLIINKKAAGREKDRLDAIRLENS